MKPTAWLGNPDGRGGPFFEETSPNRCGCDALRFWYAEEIEYILTEIEELSV